MSREEWIELSEQRVAAELAPWNDAFQKELLKIQSHYHGRGMLDSSPFVNAVFAEGSAELEKRASFIWQSMQDAIHATKRAHQLVDEDVLCKQLAAAVSAQRDRVAPILSQFTKRVSDSLLNKGLLQSGALDQRCEQLISRYESEARLFARRRVNDATVNRLDLWKAALLNRRGVAIIAGAFLVVAFLVDLVSGVIGIWPAIVSMLR